MFIDFTDKERVIQDSWKNWSYYADCKEEQWLMKPSDWVAEVLKKLPKNIDTVYDFGCGNGRNFIPFEKSDRKFKLKGYDIHPEEEIKWAYNFVDIDYTRASIQKVCEESYKFHDSLKNSLVMTAGTLMYVTPETQNLFLKKMQDNFCSNFAFFEHEPESKRPDGVFGIPTKSFNIIKPAGYSQKSPGVVYYRLS
tara:strand:- start:419 stop:1003 length:585 start_codon:yes stop_codon:yes gene_type:complete